MRQASELDYDLLINWCQAFYQEALTEIADSDQAKRLIERHLKNNTLFLWQDKVPVSSAICMGTTPNGTRISFVYTPPQHRNKGYASSCVAALSQSLLDQGQKYCFLFTDLANPTSNHIYQAIGYQAVGDMHEYRFEDGNFEQ